ncbi:MAG TPA: Uma2 family endonuclease [Thermomicrobiales bacterium]|nr:Uma2 family endonuclease [Thermomicrobiales bacterium]
MTAQWARRRFTTAEYEQMAAAGILGEDDRVELVAGEIVAMSPVGGRHVECVNYLNDFLTGLDLVRRAALVSVQNPIRLPDDSEPQPDIALLRRRAYRGAVPTAADVLLVIEVADSSREYDRGAKMALCAAAGIPETWLVDMPGQLMERHSDPRDGIYRLVARAGRDETLASTVLPGLTFSTDAVLG